MMPGTGPGRGMPWWRHWRGKLRLVRNDLVWRTPEYDWEFDPEPPRPGRVVATIGGKRT